MLRTLAVLGGAAALLATAGDVASAADPPFRAVRIAQVTQPVYLTQPKGDPRLFVVEKTGAIRVIKGGRLLARPFVNLAGQVSNGGEQGLLGLAFHPDFASNGRFYVDLTDRNGDTRIWELHAKKGRDVADPGHRELLKIDQPYDNHNGGQVAFGPDGNLYIGMGDGGSGGDPHGNGQRLDTLLAKILRIDVDTRTGGRPYGIPEDNPFTGRSGARPEIFAYGLRNPWRFSFDGQTLYIGDVGQNLYEEVDAVPLATARGADFGWNAYEGKHRYDGGNALDTAGKYVPPVVEYSHQSGCSVTGGYVYRGSRIPSLRGVYLYADYCTTHLWGFRLRAGTAAGLTDYARVLRQASVNQVSSFGQDQAGDVYVLSQLGGVFELVPR